MTTITTLDGGTTRVPPRALDDLREQLDGTVLLPGDDGWDDAILIWNGLVATQPAVVVQPTSARDVSTAIGFATTHGLLLSVKGGGHNIAGTSIAEGGITIDLSRMREVAVDPGAKRATAQPGCQLKDLDAAAQEHGLATPLGFISEVGLAGLTLGGGMGYLTRRFGYTVDNLEEVEIVTADGEIRVANHEQHPDLFWAVRGGGGNFGVVTRFTFRLHEVGPMVYGGLIAWPFERAAEVLAAYKAFTATSPRELAVWCIMLHAPPAPFVPPEARGKKIIGMSVCYTGDPAGREEALAPIRAIGDPVVDLLEEHPYTAQQSYLDDTEPKGHHYYWKTEYISELSDELLDTVRELFAGCKIPMGQVGFLHVGGALNERAEDDGAVGNRDVRFALGALGAWEPDDPDSDAHRAWVKEAGAELQRFSTGRTYINFQTADEDEQRVRATYGSNYGRLVEIKKAYDPENLFRVNRNITPA